MSKKSFNQDFEWMVETGISFLKIDTRCLTGFVLQYLDNMYLPEEVWLIIFYVSLNDLKEKFLEFVKFLQLIEKR